MKKLLKKLVNQVPYVQRLQAQIRLQGEFAPGHFHSPVPDKNEAVTYLKSLELSRMEIPGIKLNSERQFQLLNEFEQYYGDLPFPEQPRQDCRYFYDNGFYTYADGIFLYSILRKNQPKRIVEVGSGYSSALMMETVEKFFKNGPKLTLIDPQPRRLRRLLRNDDEKWMSVVCQKAQDVPLQTFQSLEPGDLLFIDSSHVVKCGSDVQFLLFDVLPQLPVGTFVHFHDIFYPFEYPSDWLEKGRGWNESYFLRAFLSYNRDWEIYFYNPFVVLAFKDFLSARMPLCLKGASSLYIRRVEKSVAG